MNSDADPREVGPLAKEAVAEAIRLNPNLAEAHKLDGNVKWLIELEVDGGRSVLPTRNRSRSERRDGVSIARTRPVAIRSTR